MKKKTITFIAIAAQQIALIITALVFIYFGEFKLKLWGTTGYLSVFYGVVAAVITYAVGLYLMRFKFFMNASLRKVLQDMHNMLAHLSWPKILFVALAAGVGEELLFRGVLQKWLIGHSSVVLGILVASIVFGLMHAMAFVYFLLTFVIGLLFGYVYHVTDSLMLVMIWHAVYDVFAIAVVVKYPQVLGLEQYSFIESIK